MADHAPNFTARFRVRYTDGLATHTQTWRYPGAGDGPELGAVSAAITNYYTALGPGLWDTVEILTQTYALKDSDIFLPVGVGSVVGSASSTNQHLYHKANVLSFVGRTNLGKRVIFYQYGFHLAVGNDPTTDNFRITASEDTDIGNAIDALIAAGADLVGNDGAPVNWYTYANVGENDYWKGKVRNG